MAAEWSKSQFTCKTECQMLVWFSTCAAIYMHSLEGVREMKQQALLYVKQTLTDWFISIEENAQKHTSAILAVGQLNFGKGMKDGGMSARGRKAGLQKARKHGKRNMEWIERGRRQFPSWGREIPQLPRQVIKEHAVIKAAALGAGYWNWIMELVSCYLTTTVKQINHIVIWDNSSSVE